MTDLIDAAAAPEAEHLARSLAQIERAIPAGVAGECDECGEAMPRLVGGRCGFCRDGRRPPLSRFDDPAPVGADPAGGTAAPHPGATDMSKGEGYTNVSVHLRGAVRDAVRSRAADDNLTNGQAVVRLIELAIEPVIEPSVGLPHDAPTSVMQLATVPIDWLTDEIARRVANAAPVVERDAAVARAEAAEGQLAALRQQVRALVGEG